MRHALDDDGGRARHRRERSGGACNPDQMEASAGSKRMTLVAAILGSAVVFLDGTVVNVALPAIREDLDTGLAAQQWIVEAYLLTLGSLILVGGSLGDLLGRRRVFVAGLIGFGVDLGAVRDGAQRLRSCRGAGAPGHGRGAARARQPRAGHRDVPGG